MTNQFSRNPSALAARPLSGRGRHLLAVATLVLAALLVPAFLACRTPEVVAAEPSAMVIGVENLALVESTELVSGPLLSGALAAEQTATVRAEVNATVLSTMAEEGQRVARGAALARLDDSALRDGARAATAALRSADEELRWATREAERAVTLLRSGAVAARVVEESATRRTAAEAQRSDARARLTYAEQQLGKATARAPFAGTVARRAASAGDTVMPGAELFTIVDSAKLRLEAAVPAERLAELRVGAPVTFSVRGAPGRKFVGRIDRISPVADPLTRQVAVFVAVANEGGELVAGLFAEGRVATTVRTGLSLPFAAVDRELGEPAVLKVVDGRVERVAVALGLEDQDAERVEITAGVAAGDRVLMGAARLLTPGTRVELRSAS
jgi:membrane fusion protein, multidrug efflux system